MEIPPLNREQWLLLGIPSRYLDAKLVSSEHDREITWVSQFTHGGGSDKNLLYIYGEPGRGKTHLAYAILMALVERRRGWSHPLPFLDRRAATLMTDLTPSGRPIYGQYNEWSVADVIQGSTSGRPVMVLFVDDVGTEKPSEFTLAQWDWIVDSRYNHRLPTILTANIPPAEIAHWLGERPASRLAEAGEVIHLDGPDRRRE